MWYDLFLKHLFFQTNFRKMLSERQLWRHYLCECYLMSAFALYFYWTWLKWTEPIQGYAMMLAINLYSVQTIVQLTLPALPKQCNWRHTKIKLYTKYLYSRLFSIVCENHLFLVSILRKQPKKKNCVCFFCFCFLFILWIWVN